MKTAIRRALAWSLLAALVGCGGSGGGNGNNNGGVGGTPILDLSTNVATFTATQTGGALPAAVTVTATNSGGGTLALPTLTVSYSGASAYWLDATVTGSAPGPYTITLVPHHTNLSAGNQVATVQVASAGATGSPQSIGVAWQITAPTGPVISPSPTSLAFSTTAGTDPASRDITISNSGIGTLAAVTATPSYTSGSGWMTATVTGSGNAQTVTVSITAPGAGSYSGSISIASAGATTVSVPVTLTVNAPGGGGSGPVQATCKMGGDCMAYSGFDAAGLAGQASSCPAGLGAVWSTTDLTCPTTNSVGTCTTSWALPGGGSETMVVTFYNPPFTAATASGSCSSPGVWTP